MKEMSEIPILLQDDYSIQKNMKNEDQKLKKKRYSIATSKQTIGKGILLKQPVMRFKSPRNDKEIREQYV